MLRTKTFLLVLILGLNFLIGCSSDDKKTDNAEQTFKLAKEFEDDERYEEAIKRYSEVKNKYPYSQFATKAELAIADVYFKQESFGEAQINYQTFRELHPTHPQIDYVLFRVGLSYFNQLPETIDRDLALAHDAIVAFDELKEKFPNSEFIKEALEKRTSALIKLAEKEDYVGDFYFKRKIYDSALLRYEYLLERYPKQGFDERAAARAFYSAVKVNDKNKVKKFSNILKEKFPNSKELSQLKDKDLEEGLETIKDMQ